MKQAGPRSHYVRSQRTYHDAADWPGLAHAGPARATAGCHPDRMLWAEPGLAAVRPGKVGESPGSTAAL